MAVRKSSASRSSERGFALLEAIVTTLIVALVVGSAYAAMGGVAAHASDEPRRTAVRAAAANVVADLRAAVMYDSGALDALASSTQSFTVPDPTATGATLTCASTIGAAGASSVVTVTCSSAQYTESVQGLIGVQAPEPGASLTPLPRAT